MDSKTKLKCRSLLERTEYYEDAGEWRIAGSDCIIIGGAAIRAWNRVTEQVLGSGARVIMVKIGKIAGAQFADSLLKRGLKAEDMEDALEMFLTRGGWGKVSAKIDVENQSAIFRIWNSVTSRKTKSKEPTCHFVNGYLSGMLCAIFGKNIECTETKCAAKNNKFCEFKTNSFSPTRKDRRN